MINLLISDPPGTRSLAGSERLGLGEIRDLINLEMPQLNEALSSSRPNTQVQANTHTVTHILKHDLFC